MTHRTYRHLGIILCLMLMACSSDNQSPSLTDQIYNSIKSQIGKKKRTADGQQAAAQITRAQVDASQLPFLRLRIEKTGTLATAAGFAKNKNVDTYLMATEQAIYLQNGILIGTRGLGHDLMSLDHPITNLRAGFGTGPRNRIYRYLNAEGQLYWFGVTCELSAGDPKTLVQVERKYNVTPISENCEGEDYKFTNTYQLDTRSNQIWQSLQWIGPVAGYMRIEVLKP